MNRPKRSTKLRSTKQVIYEALPGAAYRLKDRAYIVDSRGCIQRVDIPKELIAKLDEADSKDKVFSTDEADS